MDFVAKADTTAAYLPRDRIFAEAIRLFGQNGFDGTSMRQIADAAGVTKPAIYYHYGSKEKLYRALVTRCFENFREAVRPVFQERGASRQRLKRLVRAHFKCYCEQEDAMRLLFTAAFSPRKEAPAIDFWKEEQPYLQLLVGIFQDALDDGQAADIDPQRWALQLYGMMLLHLIALVVLGWQPMNESADEIADTIVDAMETRIRRKAGGS